MKRAAEALRRSQRNFQELIVRPHERRERPGANPEVLLRPLRALTEGESVDLYSGMYFARLRECLADDYPAVLSIIGDEAFAELARAYLERHPSRHYSLNQLGHALPQFLAGPAQFPRRALLRDVARLERAMQEAFDAPESAALRPDELASLAPGARADVRLRLDPSVRLLALEHDVGAFVIAAHKKRPDAPRCRRRRSWLVVYRKDLVVSLFDLTEAMFAVLIAISRGEPLGRALASARSRHGRHLREAEVSRSFGVWMREGIFAASPSALTRALPTRNMGISPRGGYVPSKEDTEDTCRRRGKAPPGVRR